MVVRIAGGPSTSPKRRVTSKPLFQRAVSSTPYVAPPQRNVVSKPFNPAPAPAPQRNVVSRPYVPPATAPNPGFNFPGTEPAPAPSQVYQPAQIQQSFAAPAPGIPGGGDPGFAAPIEPPRPPRKVYDRNSWLAGDADYKEQVTEYDRALNSFRNRINAKKQQYEQDYGQAKGVTEKNQQFTLDDLGQDFGARGLSYSGMFDQTKERTADQFRNQIANLLQMKNRNTTQADEEFADFDTETKLRKSNALRQAIARMAQAQSLSDMELGY